MIIIFISGKLGSLIEGGGWRGGVSYFGLLGGLIELLELAMSEQSEPVFDELAGGGSLLVLFGVEDDGVEK